MTSVDERAREEEARSLLREAGQVRSWSPSERAEVKRAIGLELRRGKLRTARATLAVGALATASIALAIVWSSTDVPTAAKSEPAEPHAAAIPAADGAMERPPAAGGVKLSFSDGAVYRFIEGGLALDRGSVAMEVSGSSTPVLISTPMGRVVTTSARLRLTAGDVMSVAVSSGRASVEVGGRSVGLARGQEIRSDDPRLAPAPPCSSGQAVDARIHCYSKLAESDDLQAQNALYALALLFEEEVKDRPRALDLWREYLRRFPGGALCSEASQGVLRVLVDGGRFAEAEREAAAYVDRFGRAEFSRADEVELIRANLLLERLGDPERALEIYRRLSGSARAGAVRDEASRGVTRSLRALQR
jgi:hypothetical protein